ncbi:Gfo/Idh/MocA family oxidoreductase [Paracoccaceae bacterium]|nr:Gfo/Idh/MocA family oxidoreductase [Paracoccaceae bacterium]
MYKAGVIGLGRMGAFGSEKVKKHSPICWWPIAHSDAINRNEHLILHALCDKEPKQLEFCSKHYLPNETYLNAKELIQKSPIDLLSIATRTIGRCALIKHAYQNGIKAIHAEKPLCNSVSELKELEEIFSDPQFYFTLGTIRRYMPNYRLCRDLIRKKTYGKLKKIKFKLGLAPLYWSHPHTLDLFLFFNEGATVSTVKASLLNVEKCRNEITIYSDPLVDSASIKFDNDVECIIDTASGLDLELECEHASIIVKNDGEFVEIRPNYNGLAPEAILTLNDNDKQKQHGTFLPIELLRGCLSGHIGSINENKIIKNDIVMSQKISFALIRSHLAGSLEVDLEDSEFVINILANTNGLPA